MKRIFDSRIALAAVVLLAADADAGTIGGSAVISAAADGANWDYTVTLTNIGGAGADPIATFWFAWKPGENFLATSPISVTPPTGWRDVVTHAANSTTDGFAIQFDALDPTNDVAPGGSQSFSFQSADTPAQLMGDSIFHPGTPVLTAFIFSLGPLQGDGAQIVASFNSVPEPSTMVLGVLAVVGTIAGRRLRRGAKARPGTRRKSTLGTA